MSYKKHFERELTILRSSVEKPKEEGGELLINDFIPEIRMIIDKFAKQGHSGSSAPFYAGALSRTIKNTLLFKPLSPITGEEDEWNDTGETLNKGEKNEMYQNKRLSAVFKDGKEGKPYYLNAIVWQGEEEYDTFTGHVEGISSKQYIKLPFQPKTFYIDVVKDFDINKYPENEVVEGRDGKYVYRLKDKNQLKEVFEYYDRYETAVSNKQYDTRIKMCYSYINN